MPWTNKQKQMAVRACQAAKISEEQRRDLILRNFSNAHHKGKITSTSPKLTAKDFEAFMAIVERFAGGQVLHYTPGYWRESADDELRRLRFRAKRIAGDLERSGKLIADGVGLAGWIEKRVSGGATSKLEELDYNGVMALILGLENYARQHAVALASA